MAQSDIERWQDRYRNGEFKEIIAESEAEGLEYAVFKLSNGLISIELYFEVLNIPIGFLVVYEN